MDVKVTICPVAWCAPSKHGHPVSDADVQALREHAKKRDAKDLAAGERMRARGQYMSQFSPRTRPQ